MVFSNMIKTSWKWNNVIIIFRLSTSTATTSCSTMSSITFTRSRLSMNHCFIFSISRPWISVFFVFLLSNFTFQTCNPSMGASSFLLCRWAAESKEGEESFSMFSSIFRRNRRCKSICAQAKTRVCFWNQTYL